ncbi:unnamed protein product [Rhizophagus irregularis]|uniref:Uncharacterized protein n=1 Tax=Rhizophagus irregularis TaxID=588596 RepID=A0A915ZUI5_9GLOM|nr:unnamed protein product [Rhizophagus irregularis]CAB5391588.1 unnamed protein product [Rhizophagus irregularis]
MYTFLTGDSSALSNWLYLDNQAIWFKFLTLEIEVIYYYANVDRTRISNSKIDKLEKKIDNVDGKIDKVEGKVDTIEEKNNTIDATLQQLLKEIRELKENKK